jgi:hypothetical protein
MTTSDLLSYLLNDTTHPLAEPLADWLNASPRFATFATMYRDKIRKKIRNARDAESARDLLLELETAYMLARERRFSIAYEAYSAGKTRGPDFAVTFTSKLTFNVEVTRIRMVTQPAPDQQTLNGRLGETVCSKLGQMIVGMPNVVAVVVDSRMFTHLHVGTALLQLKQRAEGHDPRLFAWYGFSSPADFVKQYQRLSAVLVRTAMDDAAPRPPLLWVNPQARHPLPAPIRIILQQ